MTIGGQARLLVIDLREAGVITGPWPELRALTGKRPTTTEIRAIIRCAISRVARRIPIARLSPSEGRDL